MSNRYTKAAIVLALSAATATAGLAYGQSQGPISQAGGAVVAPAGQPNTSGQQDTWLNLGQIYDRLEAAGYTDVREIERENDGYEAKARDSKGRTVKLYIEPLEGRIVGEKLRDRKRESDPDQRGDRERAGELR
ncbi:hypothetical protein CR155_10830 [Pollutimonas nitritireducens]|uniref:PepSY domain-containing protein n=1 Tax=Pollutimonas nitritireducens TaxID=2045209 RepID=A0A2N4UFY2_9BURK|nr:PepSY domain-containing protein [Pollutimonas nitritireducens]PLC53919.1 hypothetical protein CR155_10830 [Pollutimonas nitritireducens]